MFKKGWNPASIYHSVCAFAKAMLKEKNKDWESMEKCVVVNCCECGMPFRAMGEGQFVTCPYCGAELSFMPVRNSGFSQRA